jgi:hypothetical protein
MDQGIENQSSALAKRVSVTIVLVPQMSHKSVQMGQEKEKSARYVMVKTLEKNAKGLIDKDHGTGFPSWGLRVRIPSPAPILLVNFHF